MPQLTVVVITYNSEQHLRGCLESVVSQSVFFETRVIVFDNNSQDNTLQIAHAFADSYAEVQVIASPKNLGFGTAINRASEISAGDYLYLLNPDAVLQTDDALHCLVEFAKSQPKAGLVGSKVVEPNGKVISPGRKYPEQTKMSTTFNHLPGDVPWLIGASLLIDQSAFKQISGFDEDYFLYGEEVDLCLRLRQHGFELAYCPEVVVSHVGSASADQLGSYDKKVLKTKGRYLFCYKHYPAKEVQRMIRRDGRRAQFRYQFARLVGSRKAMIYKAVRDVARKTLER